MSPFGAGIINSISKILKHSTDDIFDKTFLSTFHINETQPTATRKSVVRGTTDTPAPQFEHSGLSGLNLK